MARMPRQSWRSGGESGSASAAAREISPDSTALRTASVDEVGGGRSGARSVACASAKRGQSAMSRMRRVSLGALCIAISLPSYAQFLPNLQAKTPEEYDAYLDVLDGPVLENGAAFERAFPESALRLPVC